MRIHALQHAMHEGLGSTEEWAWDHGHTLSFTRLFDGAALPEPGTFDALFVMGGPMNIYEEEAYPWLGPEKAFIREVAGAGIPMAGICLGAQLIADALGGKVVSNGEREIGWFPVSAVGSPPDRLRPLLEDSPESFHWHGDRFELPPGAELFAASEGCPHQGFTLGDSIVGFQFHPEATEEVATAFITAEGELGEGRYVQSASQILRDPARFEAQRQRWFAFLDHWLGSGLRTASADTAG